MSFRGPARLDLDPVRRGQGFFVGGSLLPRRGRLRRALRRRLRAARRSSWLRQQSLPHQEAVPQPLAGRRPLRSQSVSVLVGSHLCHFDDVVGHFDDVVGHVRVGAPVVADTAWLSSLWRRGVRFYPLGAGGSSRAGS